jgi:hypothetical protein
MIYYRIALRVEQSWQWKSTVLTSLDTLFGFLKLYSMIPGDRIRVFFSTSPKYMDEMLARTNKGLASNSMTAEQFLKVKRCISSEEIDRLEAEAGMPESGGAPPTSVITAQPMNEESMNPLEIRRLELELGALGNHDSPYTFAPPTSMLQAIAWTKLLVKVQAGELES